VSAPPPKRPEGLGPEWDSLPHLQFTRAPAPTASDEVEDTHTAYGVRSAGRLVAEFENRKDRLAPPPPTTKKAS
jgi:hypothetical protein